MKLSIKFTMLIAIALAICSISISAVAQASAPKNNTKYGNTSISVFTEKSQPAMTSHFAVPKADFHNVENPVTSPMIRAVFRDPAVVSVRFTANKRHSFVIPKSAVYLPHVGDIELPPNLSANLKQPPLGVAHTRAREKV
jgi:hypothetical protein